MTSALVLACTAVVMVWILAYCGEEDNQDGE